MARAGAASLGWCDNEPSGHHGVGNPECRRLWQRDRRGLQLRERDDQQHAADQSRQLAAGQHGQQRRGQYQQLRPGQPVHRGTRRRFITPPPTGFTGSGSFTGLQAGASPNTAITVGLDTSAAGAKSGTAQIGFVSNGTAIPGDGTTTPLANGTAQLTGSVYRLASPVLNTSSVTVAARVGDALPSGSVSVTNSSADTFTENLKTSLGTPSAGFTASGGTQTVTAGQSTTGLGIGLASTSTSGVTTGSVGVNFVSSAVANEQGAPDQALTSGSVSLTGKVYQTASASIAPSVNFGIVHVGDTVAPQAINVANTASGALVDTITGNIGSVSGAPFTNGGGNLGTGVAAGQNSNALTVGLNTSIAGVFTGGSAGSAVLSLASHDADLADVALTTSPVTLTAQVNNYAGIGLANATKGSLTGSGLS